MKKALLFLFVLYSSLLQAEDVGYYTTGEDLYKSLYSNPRTNGAAHAYVAGVVDALSVRGYVCIPEKTTLGSVTDMVHLQLRDYPSDRVKKAASVVEDVVVKKFPCKKVWFL